MAEGAMAQGMQQASSGAQQAGRTRLDLKKSLLVGMTLFSMFFGAGNLILPPLLGAQAGEAAVPAMIGFLVTAIGFPVLGIVAVALAGDLPKLAGRVNARFALVFTVLVYLSIGPCLAIPRTSSTSFEMLAPLLPESVPLNVASIAFSVAFFAIAYTLAMRPGKLTQVLGRICAPALIILIVIIVASSIVAPLGEPTPVRAPYDNAAAVQGFLNGYQTMDLLAALNFGIVIALNIRSFGVEKPGDVAFEISRAGVVAGVLMLLIYCGLGFVGVATATYMPEAQNGAQLLTAAATGHFGLVGTVIIAAIFFIACLNVCTGLISCCSTYFAETFPKLPYAAWAAVFAVFSCVVSNFGLTAILTFSVPLLNALYPAAIVLVIMGMLHSACDRVPYVWKWVVGVVAVESVIVSVRDAFFAGAWLPFDMLPLADIGLSWLVPALVAAVIGVAHSLVVNKGGKAAAGE
ncbi:branched-chain amino acid transport system II carrier protein [uncultured Slackia sp.]|uniref:branched-chain amino acid transport system II carrier protein n=1 Tax=uncultured Slackia sp. TaxID=665903 RepID=UPI0025DA7C80|nr:branched-chain amino acid transport system II carrier protein [uncultured Slackia sp.]